MAKKVSSRVSKIKMGLISSIKSKLEEIRDGYLLCIDPSIGSGSSMPGYAIFYGMEFAESGTIYVTPSWPAHIRLQAIAECIRTEFETPDVAAVEALPVRAIGRGRSRRGHASLLQAAGAIASALPTPNLIYVDPRIWHSEVGDDYVKGDAEDAEAIGDTIIRLARTLL